MKLGYSSRRLVISKIQKMDRREIQTGKLRSTLKSISTFLFRHRKIISSSGSLWNTRFGRLASWRPSSIFLLFSTFILLPPFGVQQYYYIGSHESKSETGFSLLQFAYETGCILEQKRGRVTKSRRSCSALPPSFVELFLFFLEKTTGGELHRDALLTWKTKIRKKYKLYFL